MTLVMEEGKPRIARQGDIVLKGISGDDWSRDGLQRVHGNTLISSAVTGHSHSFEGDVEMYAEAGQMVKYVNVLSPTVKVTHSHEHPTITILKGWYEVGGEVEFDPYTKTMRMVVD